MLILNFNEIIYLRVGRAAILHNGVIDPEVYERGL
jgi:hypothetical protein